VRNEQENNTGSQNLPDNPDRSRFVWAGIGPWCKWL